MVKLYYTPTSCGASSFISAFIGRIKLDCEIVDLTTHLTDTGVDFYTINPKGNVPTLILDDGSILNENITCLEYILDLSLKNNKGYILGPENNTSDRYIVRQYLSFIASELHPVIGLFFNPTIKKDMYIRNFLLGIFDKKMKYLETYILKNKNFVYGNSFTIIDAYLHIVLGWTGYVGIDLNKHKDALRYKEFIENIPEVKKAKNRMAFFPKTTI